MVRSVFLDVGWTLAYPERTIWDIFAALCTEAGVPTDSTTCEELVRSIWRPTQDRAEAEFRGGATYPDSDAAFVEAFAGIGRLVFGQRGVAADPSDLMERFVAAFWNADNWRRYDDVLAGLGALRARGVSIGVVSNAPSDLPGFLEQLGIAPYLDFVVVSAIEGVKKPDRRIFEAALTRAGVRPDEALHVGDLYLEDIVGGRAAGIRPLLIERGPRAIFPNFRESEGRGLAAESIVTDLTQVLERLDA